ncbi:protein GrpE [Actinomycetota bacterium]|nr:protein GrpE [Actinomycetota bacterium]
MTDDARTPGSGQPDPGGEETPRVTDKRRLDPETGKLREPAADAQGAAGAPVDPLEALDFPTPDDSALAQAQAEAAERLDELQRRNAAYYNLEQQYSSYVRRSKAEALVARDQGVAAVAESLIGVLDDIELARQHGDLVGPFASIAEKLEATLGRFGVERYGAAGEVFDPTVHEALMHGHSADVTEPTVQQVLQPGYRLGERIIRAARVAVVDPDA